MGVHTIREEHINFHTGTEDAVYWLKHILSREGFQEFLSQAKRGSFDFHDDIHKKKFRLKYDEEAKDFSVEKISSY